MNSKHKFTDIRVPIEKDNPSIMRHEELCVKCKVCKKVCTEEISVYGHYDLEKTGDKAICIYCGQCANVCPVYSITEVSDVQQVKDAINDPDKIVIFQTSPSVRVSLGEAFGMEPGTYVEDKMAAVLKNLGADYVFDTTFGADLTITEEASELVQRITSGNGTLPQFTSCCPAWVEFVEIYYPELINNLSSSKSPILMQGPTIKTYFAKKAAIDPKKIVNVAVTPCTAKKYEITRAEKNDAGKYYNDENIRDMDYVITVRELSNWIKEDKIEFKALQGAEFDSLLSRGSGGGIIFGITGGVMESAIRTAYYYITKKNPPKDLYNLEAVGNMDGIREAQVTIGDYTINIAIVHGTANARKLIEKVKSGEKKYDFVEVMTCRGGCIGGGGQPKVKIPMADKVRQKRIAGLYNKDQSVTQRLAHENPDITKVYDEFFKKPLSPLAEELLHTVYSSKKHILGE